ncbi:MAG: hypothetical protein KatS3mg079_724 [Caloramator sp.]|nr:MAG: hypothetical protein KatS3mg079_724 [Caloramator sp.]
MNSQLIVLAPIAGVIALLFAYFLSNKIGKTGCRQ